MLRGRGYFEDIFLWTYILTLGIQSPSENGNGTKIPCVSDVIIHPNHHLTATLHLKLTGTLHLKKHRPQKKTVELNSMIPPRCHFVAWPWGWATGWEICGWKRWGFWEGRDLWESWRKMAQISPYISGIILPYGSNHRTSDDEQGVYNHIRNARYFGSTTILRRWARIPRDIMPTICHDFIKEMEVWIKTILYMDDDMSWWGENCDVIQICRQETKIMYVTMTCSLDTRNRQRKMFP